MLSFDFVVMHGLRIRVSVTFFRGDLVRVDVPTALFGVRFAGVVERLENGDG